MKCPFCKQRLLQEYNRQRDAVIYHCTHCYFQGDGILWQELIRTRKALDVAVETLKLISLRYLCEYADKALDQIKQITALEQKD